MWYKLNHYLSKSYLAISLLLFLATVLVIAIKLTNKNYPTNTPSFTQTQKNTEIYKDKEGKPKYSQGACKESSQCFESGCSNQICSNDPSFMTTCEIKPDFPDKNLYKCGCIEGRCVWYK